MLYTPGFPGGTIASLDPAPGTLVAPHSEVKVVVRADNGPSAPPTTTVGTTAPGGAPEVVVPDVIGQPGYAAVDTLYGVGLHWLLEGTEASDNTPPIRFQSPDAGKVVPSGTVVYLSGSIDS